MTQRAWRSARSHRVILAALLFTSVVTPTAYLLWPWLTLYRLAFVVGVPAALLVVMCSRRIRLSIGPMGPRTRTVLMPALALLIYMLLVDVLRNDPAQGVVDFLTRLTVIGLIPLATVLHTSFWWRVRAFLLISIIPMVIGALQIFFPAVRIEALASNDSLFGFQTNEDLADYLETTGRIVGTSGSNAIRFALCLGLIAIAGFAAWRKHMGRWPLAVALVAVALAPFTFTRSLILGLVPSAVIGIAAATPNLKRLAAIFATGGVLVLATVFLLIPAVSSLNDRVGAIDDVQTIIKVRSNLYGAAYTLEHSPLWGIRYDELYESLVASYDPQDFPVGVPVERLETNHNQFGYMIRFYGLIGLGLMIWLVVATFRLITPLHDRWAKALLFGMLIFLLQYSMLHNVTLYSYPILWLLLAGVEEESRAAVRACSAQPLPSRGRVPAPTVRWHARGCPQQSE